MQSNESDEASKLSLSSHILDVSLGKPAENVKITLNKLVDGEWITNDANVKLTSSDGRASDFQQIGDSKIGIYKLRFDIDDYYFQTIGTSRLYPFIEVSWKIQFNSFNSH